MKIYYVHIDENNYITGWSEDNFEVENRISVEVDEEICEDFEIYFDGYKALNGKAIKDEVAYEESVKERQRENIRYTRETDVFPIINRGGIWYDTLTEQEKSDLMNWYQAWLDATETLVIPEKPSWLK